jgi:cytochrome c biogenesis factor
MEAISEVGSYHVSTVWNDMRGATNEQMSYDVKSRLASVIGMDTDVGFDIYVVMTESVKEELCQ